MPRPSRRQRVLDSLLASAGVAAGAVSIEALGIGSAGLNARGNRDEDGTHAQVLLDDGSTVLVREYTPVGLVDAYHSKELGMYRVLADAGLPAPAVVASRSVASAAVPRTCEAPPAKAGDPRPSRPQSTRSIACPRPSSA